MSKPTGIEAELSKVQYDLTSLKARISEIQRQVADLNITPSERPKCPDCHLTFKGALSLAEHLYNQHQGPLPSHYDKAEGQAVEEPEPIATDAELADSIRHAEQQTDEQGSADGYYKLEWVEDPVLGRIQRWIPRKPADELDTQDELIAQADNDIPF